MKALRFNGDVLVTEIDSMEYLKEIKYNRAFIIFQKKGIRQNL